MELTCKQCGSKFRAAIELPLARAVRVACPACGFQMVLKPAPGEPTLDYVRRARADLAIVNVYLKGKLGVEVTEDIKNDPSLAHTRVILIGALFRANRFRANPTNLYGADEYIEEQIPEKEFRQIVRKLFPQ